MNKLSIKDLQIKQGLDLEFKIMLAKRRIQEWVDFHGEDSVYVSWSGGKDSTVLGHLVRTIYPNIPFVFCDTGLEFPEIKEFAEKQHNIIFVRPDISFIEVIKKYGYPVINKECAVKLYKLKENNLTPNYRNYLLYGDERGNYGTLPKKYHQYIKSDFKIGAGCCNAMKKRPLKKYEKWSGRTASFTGEMACESLSRQQQYLKYGCNAFDRKEGFKSTPLAIWTEQDVLRYIDVNMIEVASVYGEIIHNEDEDYTTTGEKRTGCVWCGFGANYCDENNKTRFQRLSYTHPQLHDYCMNGGHYNEEGKWEPHKGLGMAHVLDTLEIEY